MRTLSTNQEVVYSRAGYKVHVKILIEDASSSMVDMTSLFNMNWVISCSWEQTVDDAGATFSASLIGRQGSLSLNPWDELSEVNLLSGSYEPLIQVARRIQIKTATVWNTPGVGDWELVFEGVIDTISIGNTLELSGRDLIGILQDRFIEEGGVFSTSGGTIVETVMQDILDDVFGTSIIVLDVPSSPGWAITEFESEQQSVYDQLQVLADQIGWLVGYKWDTTEFKLTLYSIERSKTTPDTELPASVLLSAAPLDVDVADIRNAIDVTFGDPTNVQADGSLTPVTVTRTDSSSITKYGRRWMGVTFDSTSNITTTTEAEDFADICLADLKEPWASYSVTVRYRHYFELGDLVTIGADDRYLTTSVDMGVVGIRHTLEKDSKRTELTLRAQGPSGGCRRWLEHGAFLGNSPLRVTQPPSAGTPSVQGILGGIRVRLPPRTTTGLGKQHGITWEVHAGVTGFTPDTSASSDTFIGKFPTGSIDLVVDGTSLLPDTAQEIVCTLKDSHGNAQVAYRVSAQANRFGAHALGLSDRIGPGIPGALFLATSRGTTLPPDNWHMVVGTWGSDAYQDDGTVFASPMSGSQVLCLHNNATGTSLASDKIPVTATKSYVGRIEWQASSTSHNVFADIEWFEADGTPISSTSIIDNPAAASNTWQVDSIRVSPPASACWARLVLSKAAATFFVAIDSLSVDELVGIQEILEATSTTQVIEPFDFTDDFLGNDTGLRYGSLPWTRYGPVSATKTAPSYVTAKPWSQIGLLTLITQTTSGSTGGLSLGINGTEMLIGPPPEDTYFFFKALLGSTTHTTVWAGVWSHQTTEPDAALANTVYGIGVICRGSGSTPNWFGICRDGTAESTVDLGVAATTSWALIGWRRTSTGIQFTVSSVDTGSEITTNIPGTSRKMFPSFVVRNTTGSSRTLTVDLFSLKGSSYRI